MKLQDKIIRLAAEQGGPCVTISMNTHRNGSGQNADAKKLKNLLAQTEEQIIQLYGKNLARELLRKTSKIGARINHSFNLDSLHLFLSNYTEELVRLSFPTFEDCSHIGDTFELEVMMKAINRCEEYFVLLISDDGVHLYQAMNDGISYELVNDHFPFPPNSNYLEEHIGRGPAQLADSQVRDYFNYVDLCVCDACLSAGMSCVVVATPENYSYLMQTAGSPEIYLGFSPLDSRRCKPYQIAAQGWDIARWTLYRRRTEAIAEMREAFSGSKILTNPEDISHAASEGQGDMLIVYEDYTRPEVEPAACQETTEHIAVDVIAHKGRVFFTTQDDIRQFGDMVLTVR